MRRRTGLVFAVLATTLLTVTAPLGAKNPKPKPKAGGGNSSAAHRCQHGGYRSLVGADGTTFKNTGACVRFRAHGGVFATGIIIPAGKIATKPKRRVPAVRLVGRDSGDSRGLGSRFAAIPSEPCGNPVERARQLGITATVPPSKVAMIGGRVRR
jgi:hypothetical protein